MDRKRAVIGYLLSSIALVCIPARAEIANVTVSGVTPTQAIIQYTAPDQNPCSVQVSENVTYFPLAHDVDPLLFPGAQLDSRPGSITYLTSRTFVAGARSAQIARDGRRYSRALQAMTKHYFQITCGLDQATGSFSTTNIPVGAGYFDPIPVDPSAPGVTAWPGFYGRNRSDSVIDPQTGLKIVRGTMAQDTFDQRTGLKIFEAQDAGSVWGRSNCADPTSCVNGSGTLANSSGGSGPLFISNRDNSPVFQAKSYQQNLSYDWTKLNLTAWCSGQDCGSASELDRTISVCLTVDRVNCESDAIDQVLGTGQAGYAIGGTNPILLDWTVSPSKLNMWEMQHFEGTVQVTKGSPKVTWTSGDPFSIWWTNGSVINISGVNYTIASIASNQSLVLTSAWTGNSASVPYSANNTGFLIRKKTATANAISIGKATFDYGYSITLAADSSGLQQLYWTCSPVEQDLGGGTLGRLCATALGLYAVESATGFHRSLGAPAIYVSGQYGLTGCPVGLSSAVFDSTDPNKFYCLAQDASGRSSIFSLKYYGDHSDVGPFNYNEYVYRGQTCDANHANQPCMDQVNLSAPPNHLEGQLSTHPDWALAPTAFIAIGGRQGNKIGLWGHMGSQNSRGWQFVFDPATGRVTGATPTFRHWPARWAGVHSWNNIEDPNFVRMPIGDLVAVGGALSGPDTPGLGPYGAKYLGYWDGGDWNTKAMPAKGQACPAQPAGSPIAAIDWPGGNNCVRIQVDGETCDPSPGVLTSGTVSSGQTTSDIVASSGVWVPTNDGKPIVINGNPYTFHYVSSSTGTITPAAPAAYSNQPYTLQVESTIHSPKCGNQAAFYLQDADVRDVLMFTSGNPGSWVSQDTEFMRLIAKNGTDWWLERGYKGQKFQTGWPSNMMIWQYQASCPFTGDVTVEACDVMWNFTADPIATNTSGNTLIMDAGDIAGHTGASFGAGFGVDAKPYPSGPGYPSCPPVTDWSGFPRRGCYFVRQGPIPAYQAALPTFPASMPAFAGLLGIGTPNNVDTHPTFNQIAAPPNEQKWFMDARPLNGGPLMVGSSTSPGVNVGGSLWKFTYAQRGCSSAAECSRQRKLLPTLASVNRFPLLDVSGPQLSRQESRPTGGTVSRSIASTGVMLGTGQGDWFKYCVVEQAGECYPNSAAGDLYVNAPISQPFCDYPGIAVSGGGTFDPCIGPAGAYTQSIVQIGFGASGTNDFSGSLSRVLTHGLMRYRWFTPFWNVRTSQDASWLFWRADWLDGVRGEWMAAKMLPYPESDKVNRSDFIPITIPVTPTDPNAKSAQIEFGYAENGSSDQFFCTSRREACIKGAQTNADDYAYAGDRTAPISCASQCQITIPAISQRVLYYRVMFFDASGTALLPATGSVAVSVQ